MIQLKLVCEIFFLKKTLTEIYHMLSFCVNIQHVILQQCWKLAIDLRAVFSFITETVSFVDHV